MSSAINYGGNGIEAFSGSLNSSGSFIPSTISFILQHATPNYVGAQLIIPSASTGDPREDTIALFITSSGKNPLIGVGTNDPKSALDVKDVSDTGEGTLQVFESSRTLTGGSVGDKAGTLLFTVPSGSFNDYKTSGSVASIESEITEVNELGVKGDLVFKSSATVKSAPSEVFRVNQTLSNFSSSLKTHGSLTIGTNSVLMTNIEDTPNNDSLQTIDSFSDSIYDGAIYDYTLVDSINGYGRIGQFMVISDGTNVSYTDTSTRALGSDPVEPTITATHSGAGTVQVQITNGGGYVFKSLRKLI